MVTAAIEIQTVIDNKEFIMQESKYYIEFRFLDKKGIQRLTGIVDLTNDDEVINHRFSDLKKIHSTKENIAFLVCLVDKTDSKVFDEFQINAGSFQQITGHIPTPREYIVFDRSYKKYIKVMQPLQELMRINTVMYQNHKKALEIVRKVKSTHEAENKPRPKYLRVQTPSANSENLKK